MFADSGRIHVVATRCAHRRLIAKRGKEEGIIFQLAAQCTVLRIEGEYGTSFRHGKYCIVVVLTFEFVFGKGNVRFNVVFAKNINLEAVSSSFNINVCCFFCVVCRSKVVATHYARKVVVVCFLLLIHVHSISFACRRSFRDRGNGSLRIYNNFKVKRVANVAACNGSRKYSGNFFRRVSCGKYVVFNSYVARLKCPRNGDIAVSRTLGGKCVGYCAAKYSGNTQGIFFGCNLVVSRNGGVINHLNKVTNVGIFNIFNGNSAEGIVGAACTKEVGNGLGFDSIFYFTRLNAFKRSNHRAVFFAPYEFKRLNLAVMNCRARFKKYIYVEEFIVIYVGNTDVLLDAFFIRESQVVAIFTCNFFSVNVNSNFIAFAPNRIVGSHKVAAHLTGEIEVILL